MNNLYDTCEKVLMWGSVFFTIVLVSYLAYLQYRKVKHRRAHRRHRARRAMKQASEQAAEQHPPQNQPS